MKWSWGSFLLFISPCIYFECVTTTNTDDIDTEILLLWVYWTCASSPMLAQYSRMLHATDGISHVFEMIGVFSFFLHWFQSIVDVYFLWYQCKRANLQCLHIYCLWDFSILLHNKQTNALSVMLRNVTRAKKNWSYTIHAMVHQKGSPSYFRTKSMKSINQIQSK